MSRASDKLSALDSLLGTTSFRGGVVRSRNGVFTDADGLDPAEDSLESLIPRGTGVGPCSAYQHGKLRGEKRCHGCGRTRNEVEIDR